MTTRQTLINQIIQVINQLPEEKAQAIADFADFIFKRYEESQLTLAIHQLASESQAFDFLHQEEDIYTKADLKEIFNG